MLRSMAAAIDYVAFQFVGIVFASTPKLQNTAVGVIIPELPAILL